MFAVGAYQVADGLTFVPLMFAAPVIDTVPPPSFTNKQLPPFQVKIEGYAPSRLTTIGLVI